MFWFYFWITVAILVGATVATVLACYAAVQFDEGSRLLGLLAAVGAVAIFSGGIAWLVSLDDDGRVCVRSSVIIINGSPYSVCDEYATPLD